MTRKYGASESSTVKKVQVKNDHLATIGSQRVLLFCMNLGFEWAE